MRLFLNAGNAPSTKLPPGDELKKIKNESDCKVWSVEMTVTGKLFFRNKGSLKRCYDISEVRFIDSYIDNEYAPEWSVHADFEIITFDGRIIEVATWHRKIIEAALKYVRN